MISKLIAALLCAATVYLGVVALVLPFPIGGLAAFAFGWLTVAIFRDLWKAFPR